MKRHPIVVTLDSGERISASDLFRHPLNVWPVTYQCIYERIKNGKTNLNDLLAPPRNSNVKVPESSRALKASPWRLGPLLQTDRARQTWEKIQKQCQGETRGAPRLDLRGRKQGALTIMRPGPTVNARTTWICKCTCGRTVTVATNSLRHIGIENCGCGSSRGTGAALAKKEDKP